MNPFEYRVRFHDDLLEKHDCDFIGSNFPDYEEVWKRFIGHRGDGRMAEMQNITKQLNEKRVKFALHHYIVFESLVLMHEIVDDHLLSYPVNNIPEFYKILNLIVAFQAHAGRVKDNMKACLKSILCASKWNRYEKKFAGFYTNRNTFLHGRKVPFMLDKDSIFRTTVTNNHSKRRNGTKQDANWESIPLTSMSLIHNQVSDDFVNSGKIVNEFLDELNNLVGKIISNNNLEIFNSKEKAYPQAHISSSMGPQGEDIMIITASGNSNDNLIKHDLLETER
jgi:hypothetical protein